MVQKPIFEERQENNLSKMEIYSTKYISSSKTEIAQWK